MEALIPAITWPSPRRVSRNAICQLPWQPGACLLRSAFHLSTGGELRMASYDDDDDDDDDDGGGGGDDDDDVDDDDDHHHHFVVLGLIVYYYCMINLFVK